MKKTIKTIAALTILALATPAIAGGVTVAEQGDSKLKLGAKFFTNFTANKTQGDGTAAGNALIQKKDMGAALDRAYFSLKYQFDDVWSMSLTTDANIDTGLAKKTTNVFIKKAYLRGKLADEFVISAGVIGTPFIGYENKLNTHRYVHKSFTDTYKFDDSADAGIGISGKLADGLIQYSIAELNGGGFGNISRNNSLDFNSRVGIYPIEGLTLDVQFRDGFRSSKVFNKANQANNAGTKHTLIQGMITYGVDKTFRIGGNYIYEKSDQKLDVANAIAQQTTKSTGLDVWGWVNFNDNVGVFGQFEQLKQKRAAGAQPKTTRFVGGLEFTARKNVRLALVADVSKTTDAAFTTGAVIKTSKFGLYSEVKF
ncbi:MAG: hypothetical protein JKY87_05630 [Mariprofundus sp.]|nr:hypothetical protein [Mariprofundus sp.]